jgi:NDP-sugar pyrophosphorylase family protein
VRLGTGGALLHALPKLADPFMVLNGDSYVPGIDYQEVALQFKNVREEGMAGLMVVYPVAGNVDFIDSMTPGGVVDGYRKGSMLGTHTDAGIFITSPDKLSQYAEGAEPPFDLSVIYNGMIRAGVLAGYETPLIPYEIGSPEGLERYRAAVREGRA